MFTKRVLAIMAVVWIFIALLVVLNLYVLLLCFRIQWEWKYAAAAVLTPVVLRFLVKFIMPRRRK